MSRFRIRTGYTLVELLLYLSLFSIISMTLVSVYIATQDARVQQQSVALVEQRGSLLLRAMSNTVRRAEAVTSPVAGATGSMLALQMSQNAENPTLIVRTSTGNLVLIQKITQTALLDSGIIVEQFVARNIGGTSIFLSLDLSTTIPSVPPKVFTRHFESTVALNPDDTHDGGGCGSCTPPVCTDHLLRWYHCDNQVCTLSTTTLDC